MHMFPLGKIFILTLTKMLYYISLMETITCWDTFRFFLFLCFLALFSLWIACEQVTSGLAEISDHTHTSAMIISEQSAVKAFTLIMLDWQSIKKRNKLKKLTRVFQHSLTFLKQHLSFWLHALMQPVSVKSDSRDWPLLEVLTTCSLSRGGWRVLLTAM